MRGQFIGAAKAGKLIRFAIIREGAVNAQEAPWREAPADDIAAAILVAGSLRERSRIKSAIPGWKRTGKAAKSSPRALERALIEKYRPCLCVFFRSSQTGHHLRRL